MKKIYSLFLIAAVLAACVGCKARTHQHSFGEWETKMTASCDSAAVEARKCACGEEETREGDPATGHTFTAIAAVSALEKPMAGMTVTASDLRVTATCAQGESVAVTEGITVENATLALGKNTVTVKYGDLSTTLDIEASELDISLDASVTDDAHISSGSKDKENSSKKEMGTKVDQFRVYLRINVCEILDTDLFAANKANAKVQLILPITSGIATDKTTFKLRSFAPAAGVTDVDFSKLTWNSADKDGMYGTLNWSNGTVLVDAGVGHNVTVQNDQITMTLSYSQIADFVDESGNIIFAFATNTDGLKIGSLENKTKENRPAFKILLNDEHFHIFDQEVAQSKYLVSAGCKERAKYRVSCACGEAGAETFTYGGVIDHDYGEAIPEKLHTCTTDGVKEHYQCNRCGKYFLYRDGQMKLVKAEDLKLSAGHDMKVIGAKEPTCTKGGNNKYYQCKVCSKYFVDKEGTTETTKDAQKTEALGHSYTSISAVSNLDNPMETMVVKVEDLSVTGTCGSCGESIAITEGIELENATLVYGENTVTVKYGELSTTLTIEAAELNIVLNGTISDDTYVSSSSKNSEYTAREEMGTNSSSFRIYLRANVSDILQNEQFLSNKETAKVQLSFSVTSGSVLDSTNFTLKAYTPAVGVTDAPFSALTWNSVDNKEGSVGAYSQLNWNNGVVLTPDVQAENSKVIIELGYDQISDYIDQDSNILFAFATNTSGLKVGSIENTTETNKPAFKVVING